MDKNASKIKKRNGEDMKAGEWKKAKKRRAKASDVLFSFFDGIIDAVGNFGDHKPYRISKAEYFRMKNCAPSDIRQQFYDLKKRRLIRSVVENNEHYFELTSTGRENLAWSMIGRIKRTQKWDKSFRLVMFDVPENKKNARDVIRNKLEEIGFIQMQKSVFVFPFDCKKDIESLCYFTNSTSYLKYLVVKITEGEKELIEEFLSRNILALDDLK